MEDNQPVTPQQPSEPVQFQSHNTPLAPKRNVKRLIAILTPIVLVAIVGGLFAYQTVSANSYKDKAKKFGTSTAVTQINTLTDEFTANNSLFADMYVCKAKAADTIKTIDRKGSSYFSNEAVDAYLKDYSEAHDYFVAQSPGTFKPLPLFGSFGAAKQATTASNTIAEFVATSQKLKTVNDHSRYCLTNIYGMLSGQVPYLYFFSDEAKLADSFTSKSTNAQQKLDTLKQYKSYGEPSIPSGFEDVSKYRAQFMSSVELELNQLVSREKSNPGFAFALGTAYTGFKQTLNYFDSALISEAASQFERHSDFTPSSLKDALNKVKAI